jgi:hypothetical protein
MNIDSNILKDLFKGILGILIAVFLPKQIFICIREVILFCFRSLINSWIVAISVTIFCIGIYYWLPYQFLLKEFIIVSFLIILLACSLTELFKLHKHLSKKGSIVIYGCFSTRDKEYLLIDVDAEGINEILKEECKYLKANHFVFKKGILNLEFISLPKFIPLLLGYRGSKKFFENFINKGKHVVSLHFIRNISDQQLVTSLNYNIEYFANGQFLKQVDTLIDKISNEKNLGQREVASINLKFLVLIFSQSFLDYVIDNGQHSDAQVIVEESDQLLNDLKATFTRNQIEISEADDFFNIWKSYINRHRAIVLLEQNELRGAATYLISAIKLNPYYPYFNYHTFKDNYTKRYGIELSYSIEKMSKILDTNTDNDFDKVRNKIREGIISIDADFNHNLLLQIIAKDQKGINYNHIEQELLKLENDNIATMLIKAEVLKYLPDGSEKINEAYSGRLDGVIELLKEIALRDSSFSVIHSKIGSLLMNKLMLNPDESKMKEAMDLWVNGMHFLTELGFSIHTPITNKDEI